MKRYLPLLALLAGCPSDPSNPSRLWLNTDGVETKVKLQDSEPIPF